MASLWARWRRRRAVIARPVPDALWAATLSRYPFLALRDAAQLAALRDMTAAFLAEKEFTGAGGLQVDDTIAVAIAAQACLPALALGIEWLDGFVGIVVHPDAVVAAREVEDEDGVVHAFDEELSGEAMQGGPVMLAWRDVAEAGLSAVDGYNVVVHEFAHVMDMRGGLTAGAQEADASKPRGVWQSSLLDAWSRFADAVEDGASTFLDPYGAESAQEFFAVAAEAFFVAPLELRNEQPAAYDLLVEFFRQDPAAAAAGS